MFKKRWSEKFLQTKKKSGQKSTRNLKRWSEKYILTKKGGHKSTY